ncbi:ATP-dependent helicase [Propionibacteriaceae bacterium G57]|uniref:ATP-dependent helicase n=1 Tax=Aestuariimicrobium sp. G57 TaxID=3418485 RepID=UPI003DA77AA2
MNSHVSPDQQRVVDWVASGQAGALLVWGGPGTGKTQTLVQCAATALESGLTGPQVLLLTTTRSLAQRLRNDLMRRIGGAQVAPRVMTAHALAHSIVAANPLPDEPLWRLLTAPEQEFRLRELLAAHDTSGWSPDLQRAATTRAFAGEVRAAVARVRQLGLDPEQVQAIGEAQGRPEIQGRPEWAALGQFMHDYLDVVDATFEMDYAELVHRARLRLLDQDVLAKVVAATPLVLLDDLTELDPSQVQLVADLVAAGSRLVAFGDPTSSVYGFRGAGGISAARYGEIFGGEGFGTRAPASRIDLDQDFGRGTLITGALGALAGRLPRNDRVPVPVPAVGVDTWRGTVQVRVHDSSGAEIDHIVDQVRAAHLHDGWAWHDIAVITRSQRGGLMQIARALTAAGVPVQMAGTDIALGESPAVRPLLLGLRAAIGEVTDPERQTSTSPADATDLLRSPLGGLDSLEVRRLGRQLRAAHAEDQVTSGEWFTRLLDDPTMADGLSGEPARKAVELAQRLACTRTVIDEGGDVSSALWTLWDGTGWAARAEREALAGGDASAAAHRDLDAVRALFDLAARDTELVGVRSVRQLLDELVTHQIPADTARESDLGRRGVHVLTAHRAKGLRWPVVVVAQVQEGTWPATRRQGSILDVARLSPDGVLAPEPFSRLIDAERRSFLLACSRATHRLVVTAAQGHEGEGDQASRFLTELDVPVDEVVGRPRRALSLPAMVARLRAAVLDPTTSPALREAAASRLARLSGLRDRHGRQLARGADPANWWGILDYTRSEVGVVAADEPVRLSGSSLEELLACPRKWFLSKQASAEEGRSSAASFGSVVHALVSHAEQDDLGPEDLQGHLDSIWDQIPFDAAWLSASERVEVDQALDRYLYWAAGRGEAVGTEVPFDIELEVEGERVQLTGSVDRLERDAAGRLRVVDFKTGRVLPTLAEAAANVQLALYQLAATAGAFDQVAPGARGVSGGELVFLRKGNESPKSYVQASIDETPWPKGTDDSSGATSFIHEAVAHAARVVREERFDAQPGPRCQMCTFRVSCPTVSLNPQVGR